MSTDARAARSADARRQNRLAMRLSLVVGVGMLAGKVSAYWLTGSAAILSDAAESVIHVGAVAFAAFALQLSARPADTKFPYGYERIAFISAGVEGAMIILAAVTIIVTVVHKWQHGLTVDSLGTGTLIVAGAALLNGILGSYLVRVGRRTRSVILEANGRHVLTDFWTSLGVIGGLVLVLITGWLPFDPLIAIAVALNILWSGFQLVSRSVGGLMDYANPALTASIGAHVDLLCRDLQLQKHRLRVRDTGYRVLVEIHLLFPFGITLGEAHRRATVLEDRVATAIDAEAEVITHLEAIEDHATVHGRGH